MSSILISLNACFNEIINQTREAINIKINIACQVLDEMIKSLNVEVKNIVRVVIIMPNGANQSRFFPTFL